MTAARREYERNWQRNNKDRVAKYARNRRMRNRSPCQHCGSPLPYPSQGRRYCSDTCALAVQVAKRVAKRIKAQAALDAYKIERGCDHCGYRACSAALHFHHQDPARKSMRIGSAVQFVAASNRSREELGKCALVCANCHAEIHSAMRDSRLFVA